jgi:hypothetical protein
VRARPAFHRQGATWTIVDNGLPVIGVNAFATVPNESGGTDLYAGTAEGVFRTSDNGDHWTNVSFIYSLVRKLEVTPSGAILAGTEADVFRSTDGGATWTDTNSEAAPLDFAVNLHGTGGVSVFVGGSPTGVRKSTDDGMTWSGPDNSLDDLDVNSVAVVPNGSGGSNILAGAYSGIFLSTNDAGFWQHVEPNPMPIDWVVTPNGAGGHNVFGGGAGGVWRSTNYGLTWAPSDSQTPACWHGHDRERRECVRGRESVWVSVDRSRARPGRSSTTASPTSGSPRSSAPTGPISSSRARVGSSSRPTTATAGRRSALG